MVNKKTNIRRRPRPGEVKMSEDEEVVFETIVHCSSKPGSDEDSDGEYEQRMDTGDSVPSPVPEPVKIYISSESEEEIIEDEWSNKHEKVFTKSFTFNKANSGIQPRIKRKFQGKKPYDFFCMFLDNVLLQQMVDATNEYAKTCLENNSMLNTWIQPWKETNIDEMRKFIGIIMWMGLVQYPTLNSYWCKDRLYINAVSNELSRSKFQLLMYMWRFSAGGEKSLDQIEPLISNLKKKFQQVLEPAEVFSVDRTFIPFENRSGGLNLLTLNLKGGYIYNFDVNIGEKSALIHPNHTMKLVTSVLDKGRTICTNEEWTTLSLAHRLMGRKTNLIGCIRANPSQIPSSILKKKLTQNETYSEVTPTGISILKCSQPSEQYLLTTRRTVRQRCTNLTDFNRMYSSTKIADQLKSANTIIMKNINWYQKLAIELLIGACLVNACYLYRKICTKKISSSRFKEEIVQNLLQLSTDKKQMKSSDVLDMENYDRSSAAQHKMVKRLKKNRCTSCYEKVAKEYGRKYAANRGTKGFYECDVCRKYLCIECFFELHTSEKRLK